MIKKVVLGACLIFLFFFVKVSSASDNKFYSFDLNFSFTNNDGFDKGLMVSSLQGLVNRDGPQLYIYKTAMPWSDYFKYYTDRGFSGADDFWIKQATKAGSWLSGYREEKISTIDGLLSKFPNINKVVVWDPRVGATSNIAVTIAGVENALPVMHGGNMYQKLVGQMNYAVVVNLYSLNFTDTSRIPGSSTPSSGSSKVNAYIWAKEKYIDTGRVDSNYLGLLEHYFGSGIPLNDPADQVTAHDIVVSKRGFVFDLSPWTDEAPLDDKNQTVGKDRWAFGEIMKSASSKADWNKGIIEVFGFPPWWTKYCKYKDKDSKHENWELEHKVVEILSTYGAGLIPAASLGVNNMSFHQHYWSLNKQVWQPVSSFPQLGNKTYIMYVTGDYDDLTLTRSILPVNQDRDKNINMPLTWGINSVNYKYFGDLVGYAYENNKSGDSISGHVSGCIYINPNFWPSNRWSSYSKYCQNINTRMDISDSSFILKGDNISVADKSSSLYLDSFFSFSGNGMGVVSPTRQFGENFLYKNRMPVIAGLAPPSNVDNAHAYFMNKINEGFLGNKFDLGKKANFVFMRFGPDFYRGNILDLHNKIKNQFGSSGWGEVVAVNSKDFYYLSRMALQNPNYLYRASYKMESLPNVMGVGETTRIKVVVRNNAKDVWYKNGDSLSDGKPYRLTTSVVVAGQDHSWATFNNSDYSPGRVELTRSVGLGQTDVFSFVLKAPNTKGVYRLAVDMMREGVTGFREQGQPALEMEFEAGESCQILSGSASISHLITWYGTYRSETYKKEADFNCDTKVDIKDLLLWYGIYKK